MDTRLAATKRIRGQTTDMLSFVAKCLSIGTLAVINIMTDLTDRHAYLHHQVQGVWEGVELHLILIT